MDQIKPEEVPQAERWPLLAEARAIFGPVAAAELAEAMGMIRHGDLDKSAA